VQIRSLQTRIVVFFVLLLFALQMGGFLLINTAGVNNARKTIADELVTGERVFNRLLEQNSLQLAQGASILSADFAFREAIGTNDRGTITSALSNHGARINAKLMLLIGLDQQVIADTLPATLVGQRFSLPRMIAAAEQQGKASSIVVFNGALYQLVVVPVLAPVPIAWVAMGFAIDDGVAGDLEKLIGLQVSFLSHNGPGGWRINATTLPAQLRPQLTEGLTGKHFDRPEGPTMPALDHDEYVTLVSAQPTQTDEPVVAVLQQSLGHALEPFKRLRSQLIAFTALAMLISIIGSLLIARGIARPVQTLASFARRIAAGDYSEPPDIKRNDEIGDLAAAFDHMREGIANRESKIMDLAYRDTLTDLPNRALFTDRLQQAISTSKRLNRPLTVIIMNLDRFRYVNDSLGHHLGDLLLVEVGQRLQSVLRRQSDTIARIGGDEFAILMPTEDTGEALNVAHKLQQCLEAPMMLEGHLVDAHASMGLATYPEHGEDLVTLLRHADSAMYLAKRNSTSLAVYDPRYDQHTLQRLSLMSELRQAVEQDELVLYYQPKIDLCASDVNYVEALVRWHHPTRGFVPPNEFIPFAEQTGYIKAITGWVIDQALAQCAKWRREGMNVNVSINISARDLVNAELPSRVAALLSNHGCVAEWVWLEITESAILDDPGLAMENLDRLHALGCKLSIDDFGTGYSSLAYLKRLPVDELKIDKSFVMGMVSDPNDAVIVRSTIDLGHNMGLKVVAEGVENELTLNQLKAMGCDLVQGFLMSKPLPAEEFERWIRESPWGSNRQLHGTRPPALIA